MRWRATNTVAKPLAMKRNVAATERGERRAKPQTPWPEVQPLPIRLPKPTKQAIENHTFYRALVSAQHEVPMVCPWRAPRQQESLNLCDHPFGVVPRGVEVAENQVSESLTPGVLAAAKQDAASMNIRWAVVWKRNGSVSKFLLTYLKNTGFNYAYRYPEHGKDQVLVFKRLYAPG